jgi:putative phosphoesterase
MKLGILSDTHDYLDARLDQLFIGVDHILHGGDVGMQQIILELGFRAPVTAVLGNTDMGNPLKLTEVVTLAGRKFLLHHIVNPHAPDEKFRMLLAKHRPDVVIFGHTHRAFDEVIGGVRFFNPGYAGKPKLGTERSVAILHCDEKEMRAEFLAL